MGFLINNSCVIKLKGKKLKMPYDITINKDECAWSAIHSILADSLKIDEADHILTDEILI